MFSIPRDAQQLENAEAQLGGTLSAVMGDSE